MKNIFSTIKASEPQVKEYRLMYFFGAWVTASAIYAESDTEAIHDADEAYKSGSLHKFANVALFDGNRQVKCYSEAAIYGTPVFCN